MDKKITSGVERSWLLFKENIDNIHSKDKMIALIFYMGVMNY